MLTEAGTKRGDLLKQYVTARIVRMNGIDIGLFDYDRYNTLYFFILNADEHIYMRYGGRDQRSPTTYLDLESLELALEQGLEQHRLYRAGKIARKTRPPARYPRDIPELYKRTIGAGRCVECHLIGDLENVQREIDGNLDKLSQMFRSPDIRTIGIGLDIPKGLRVAQATKAAAAAGMQAGDTITHFNGKRIRTFGDLQWEYDHVDRRAQKIQLRASRGGKSVELDIALPDFWWLTDISYRNWSVDPRVYFDSEPLTAAEKRNLGLDPDGFASRVTYIDRVAELLGNHELAAGDIVYAVDGETRDEIANTAELFLKLRKQAGDRYTLQIVRNGERMETALKTDRMSFRK